jgi:hypothetical protein
MAGWTFRKLKMLESLYHPNPWLLQMQPSLEFRYVFFEALYLSSIFLHNLILPLTFK